MIKNVYFVRLGNKQTDIKFFNNYLPKDIKTIIEPFAGSFAVIRNVYYDDKYKKIINDYDIDLYNFLNKIKNNKDDINEIYNKIMPIDDKKDFLNYIDDMDKSIKIILYNTFIARGFYKKKKLKTDFTILSTFLNNDNVTIDNKNYKYYLDLYKNDKEAFIFCDPPYFDSDNTSYNMQSFINNDNKTIQDNTQMYVDLSKFIKECQCKIMIVCNKNALMCYIFDGYVKGEYKRIYQISKKINTHLIITNY